MAAAVEGAQVDVDNALEIEGRYFVDLATGQVAKNMIQAFFFDLQAVNGTRGAARGHRDVPVQEGRRARRRHDGRGHRVPVREVRHRGRAQGRLPGGGRARQGLLARSSSPRASSAARSPRRRAHALLARITPTDDPADGRRRRPRDRGGVRGPEGQGAGVRRDRAAPRRGRAAGLQHVDAADHRPRRVRVAARRLHRAALLQPGGQDAAAGDHQGREDVATRRSTARSTSPSRSPRRRSSSTTRAASSPRA